MDMKNFLKQASAAERELLAQAVGSSVGYLYLIGGGHRKASSKLCQRLVAAEPKLTLVDLRPDIWSVPQSASHSARPADDLDAEGVPHSPRILPSTKNIMSFPDTGWSQPTVAEPRIAESAQPYFPPSSG